MPLVARKASNLTPLQIAEHLRDAHVAYFGHAPSIERLAMAWAQVAFETARGRACWCFNLGNITCYANDAGEYWTARTIEYMKGDGKEPKAMNLYYRAYPSATHGAIAYWEKMHKRYRSALALFDTGDALKVATELSRLKYYTAAIATYAAGMRSLFGEFLKKYGERFVDDDVDGDVLVMPELVVRGNGPPEGSGDA